MIKHLKNYYVLNIPIKIEYLILPIPLISIFGNWMATGSYITGVFIFFIYNSILNYDFNLRIPYLLSWIFLLLWGIYIVQKSPAIRDAIYYYIGIIVIPFFIFVLFNNIKISKRFLEILFDAFILSGFILSIISISVFIESGFDLTKRIASIWQDNNILSLYLLIIFLINLSFIVNRTKGDKFFIYIVSLVTILLGIVLTQTRGVYISLIFALVIYLIKRPKIVIPIGIIVIILGIFFFKIFEDRFLSIRYFGSDVSSLGRLQAWLSTLILLKENLFLGYGFNSYIYLRDQIFAFYFVEVQHSHNTYLRTILEMGFIGFAFYFSFIFVAIKFVFSKDSKKLYEYKKFIDGLKLTFLACIPAFMFEPYFSLYGVSTICIWVFISIAFSIKHLSNENQPN